MAIKRESRGATRLAILDLGTNSVRFDIHEVADKRAPRLIHREKLMVRLGEKLFETGRLDSQAIRRTLQALGNFKKTAVELKVHKWVAFATSALREAKDRDRLLIPAKKKFGITIEVISGQEEARLIARGILANERGLKRNFAFVDIGGGSMEISVCRDRKVIYSKSFPLGAARLQQVYLKATPPLKKKGHDPVRAAKKEIRRLLEPESQHFDLDLDLVCGSSGTVRALSRIFKRMSGSEKIEFDSLKKLTKRMADMTQDELLALPGMEPRRSDLILAGSLVFEECLKALDVDVAVATDYSLRDGIFAREIQRLELEHQRPTEVDLEPLFRQAARLGDDVRELKSLVHLGERLFFQLESVHRLPEKWLTYLKLALLYRNAGKLISPLETERHTAYIVRHADLPLYEGWEVEFVAQLCLHQFQKKVNAANLMALSPQAKEVFPKMLALFQIADALHPGGVTVPAGLRARMAPRHLHLRVPRGKSAELSLMRLQQRKAFFEKVFGRQLDATVT